MMGMFLCIDFGRSHMGIGICKNVLTTQLKWVHYKSNEQMLLTEVECFIVFPLEAEWLLWWWLMCSSLRASLGSGNKAAVNIYRYADIAHFPKQNICFLYPCVSVSVSLFLSLSLHLCLSLSLSLKDIIFSM